MAATPLRAVFFDIGDTLGKVGFTPLKLTPFTDTIPLLQKVTTTLELKVGVITSLGTITEAEGKAMLSAAGLSGFLDPAGFVSEHTPGGPGVAKPDPKIYRFAAKQLNVAPEECLFIGENLAEVIGAMTAGFRVVQRMRP
jgi:HAD superfamily hydrolase (TIGR01509 family)